MFDAYGTLFDVHSAVGKYRKRLGDIADQVSSLWRTKQLEYTWLRSLMGHHFEIAILSNGTPAMLEAAVNNSGLKALIAKIFSVEIKNLLELPDLLV